MPGFFHFIHGILSQSFLLQMWILTLVVMNCILPIYFIRKWEAKVALVVFIINSLLMITLTSQFGFTRILGLGHFFWFPMLWYFRQRRKRHPWDTQYGGWLHAVILLNSISLVFDVMDVVLYVFGDRAELIPAA